MACWIGRVRDGGKKDVVVARADVGNVVSMPVVVSITSLRIVSLRLPWGGEA